MKYIKTRDLYLVGFLGLHNIPYEDIQEQNGIYFFIFQNCQSLQTLIDKYMKGKSQVEPVAYIEKIKHYRRIIKNESYNENGKHKSFLW